MKRALSRGFTLVEIIVIIIVLGILVSIVAVYYTNIQTQSRDTKRSGDMSSLGSLLEDYFIKNGTYPVGCGGVTCTDTATIQFPASVPVISTATTLTTLGTILGNNTLTTIDPQVSTQYPFIGSGYSTSNSSHGYIYRGGQRLNPSFSGTIALGTIKLTEQGSTRQCSLTVYFDSSKTTIPNYDTMAYILAYYADSTKTWQISLGNHGMKPTIDGTSTANFCVITN